MKDVIDSLIVSSLRHNYSEFVRLYGYDKANEKLHNLFGDTWLTHREDIWVWYDAGEVHTTTVVNLGVCND